MPAGDVNYRIDSHWRQEHYFRYARTDLDSHWAYTSTEGGAEGSVPNRDKKKAYPKVIAAGYTQVLARTDSAMLAIRTRPQPPTKS